MLYNFVAKFSHKIILWQTFCKRSPILHWKRPFCIVEPPLRGLGATYHDHIRLTGKRVMDFLLVLIELFARYYRWGATSEYRFKIGDFASTGAGWPKISCRKGYAYQPFFFSENWLNDLSYGIKIWTDLSSVLSQCTHLTDGQSDRQTDGRTAFSWLDRPAFNAVFLAHAV